MNETNSNSEPKRNWSVALLIGAICFVVFTCLLYVGKLQEGTYLVLVIALAVICFLIYAFPRLQGQQEIDLKSGKISLALKEVHDIQKDIYAREENVRRLTLALTELLLTASMMLNRWGSTESNAERKLLFRTKIANILTFIKASSEEHESVHRIANAFEEYDASVEHYTGPEDGKLELNNKLHQVIREEIEKSQKAQL